MIDKNLLNVFLATARALNFRKAADELGISRSAVSHAISNLEQQVGIRLLQRTTRSVSLTEAGKLLLIRTEPAWGMIDEAIDSIRNLSTNPVGTLNVSIERSLALILMPRLVSFVGDFPELDVHIFSCNEDRDIIAGGYDAGICYRKQIRDNLIAAPIDLNLEFCVVGSPKYVEKYGVPNTPDDLPSHRCIGYTTSSIDDHGWVFYRDSQQIKAAINTVFHADDQEAMLEAAREGLGLAYVARDRAERQIATAELVECLQEWCLSTRDVFMCYPSRRHKSAALEALLAHLKTDNNSINNRYGLDVLERV